MKSRVGIFRRDGKLPHSIEFVFQTSRLLVNFTMHFRLSGVLLKQIIDDMIAVADNGTSTDTHKINLFSGHEHNVAALLNALGLYEPHVPQYSSAVIIELVRYKKAYYVRVCLTGSIFFFTSILFKNYTCQTLLMFKQIIRYLGIPSHFIVEEIPNCSELCPLDKFIKLMKPVTPVDVEMECKSDKITQSQLAGLVKNFVQP